jgi:Flp pilus assembly protein TadG
MTRSKPERRRGNAILEFALAFSFLFSLFTGVFQFGYTYYVYNNLVTAVRSGARYASLRTYDSATATPSAAYTTAVRNMVVYGDPAGGAVPVTPALTPDNVTIDLDTLNNVPRAVSVGITNFRVDAVFATFTFNSKPKITFPYAGRYAPNE